jgi:S-adenosylmethionine:tRNA ribosyltransferase-isomerase
MKTREFYFNLPEELIAQKPAPNRGESRLMLLDRESGTVEHHGVAALPTLLKPGSLLVFNDTRVRHARLYGTAEDTGSTVEFLLIDRLEPDLWNCMVSRSRRQREGRRYEFPGGVQGKIEGTDGQYRRVRFSRTIDDEYLDVHGHMPLPPYIRRRDEPEDQDRYQTVYARSTGSVAAPTAGLHFTSQILEELTRHGFTSTYVTLHVGLGTFLPVRTENVLDHRMHTEQFHVSNEAASAVEQARAERRPVVAVGTTSVRTLESAWDGRRLRTGWQETGIFIYPGYKFGIVDGMFTNFHTPESTLLMLVSAFAGRERILSAYEEAVARRYRFFSYGDAMFIR